MSQLTASIIIGAFDVLSPDLEQLRREAMSKTIESWVTDQQASSGLAGAAAMIVPGLHLAATAADMAYLMNRMAATAYGIGFILTGQSNSGCIVEKEDFANILSLWGGSELLDKMKTKLTSSMEIKAGGKIAIKTLGKFVAHTLGTFVANKLGSKVAGKLVTKISKKYIAKHGAGFVPFLGPFVAAGINAWFIEDLKEPAVNYYRLKLELAHSLLYQPPRHRQQGASTSKFAVLSVLALVAMGGGFGMLYKHQKNRISSENTAKLSAEVNKQKEKCALILEKLSNQNGFTEDSSSEKEESLFYRIAQNKITSDDLQLRKSELPCANASEGPAIWRYFVRSTGNSPSAWLSLNKISDDVRQYLLENNSNLSKQVKENLQASAEQIAKRAPTAWKLSEELAQAAAWCAFSKACGAGEGIFCKTVTTKHSMLSKAANRPVAKSALPTSKPKEEPPSVSTTKDESQPVSADPIPGAIAGTGAAQALPSHPPATQLQQAIMANLSKADACANSNKPEGPVSARIRFSPYGHVSQVIINASPMPSVAYQACVRSAFIAIKVSESSEGAESVVQLLQ